MNNNSIFSLRFGSNTKLEPSHDELMSFLESRKDGSSERHRQDLDSYRQLLTAVATYKTGGSGSFYDKMLYAVLEHSSFAKPALKSAVEQYKFHLNTLSRLDFRKPAAFINSAEQEIGRLNPKKKEEAMRIERMRGMIEQRKQSLESQKKLWLDLSGELNHIISYISENLLRIEKLCEQTIGIFVNEQIDRKKELSLVEDIKTHFKERLREALHRGTIKKKDLEAAKEEVAALSTRTADFVRSDIYTMTQLYEAIHEHVGKVVKDIGGLIEEIRGKKHASLEEDLELYRRGERQLLFLLSGWRFDVKAAEIEPGTDQDKLLIEKRRETVDHLVDLLQKGGMKSSR